MYLFASESIKYTYCRLFFFRSTEKKREMYMRQTNEKKNYASKQLEIYL